MTAEKRKVLWITGAGSGIGCASAIRSSSRGWSVALTGRRDGALRETARLVTEAGGHAFVGLADIVSTNLVAAAAINLALPEHRASSGMIIAVSSFAAWRLSPLAGVAYSASKVWLSSLCESLNDQEGPNGIRACHLCPGVSTATFSSSAPSCRMRTRASRCSTRMMSLRPFN